MKRDCWIPLKEKRAKKVLVVGGGGREHALVWALEKSPSVGEIFCAPGNAGIERFAKCINIAADDVEELKRFAIFEGINLTVVGPELSLIKDIGGLFRRSKLPLFGPDASGARLEGSKRFAKEFMIKYGVPTAEYKTFTSYSEAEKYVRLKGAPIVIKADGLAAGKGVFVAETVKQAMDALKLIMKDNAFGDAGKEVVIEKCLRGEEASFMFLTDGMVTIPLATAQDHKRIFDGDKGDNTGGMGAYSPAPVITPKLNRIIESSIIAPIMRGLRKERIEYRGVIYVGLMICDGKPYVLEFNCRFGDPETQPILMRLNNDLFELLDATARGKLISAKAVWKDEAALCVVASAKGYPGAYEKGKVITGLDMFNNTNDVEIFHAGTTLNKSLEFETSGGRVYSVTALGKDIQTAKEKAYKVIKKTHFDGMHCRKDIGDRAIKRKEG